MPDPTSSDVHSETPIGAMKSGGQKEQDSPKYFHWQKVGNKFCVFEGTKGNPGKRVKCFDDKSTAYAFLKDKYYSVLGKEAPGVCSCGDVIVTIDKAHRSDGVLYHEVCCPECRDRGRSF